MFTEGKAIQVLLKCASHFSSPPGTNLSCSRVGPTQVTEKPAPPRLHAARFAKSWGRVLGCALP